jgi:hypothetical protein
MSKFDIRYSIFVALVAMPFGAWAMQASTEKKVRVNPDTPPIGIACRTSSGKVESSAIMFWGRSIDPATNQITIERIDDSGGFSSHLTSLGTEKFSIKFNKHKDLDGNEVCTISLRQVNDVDHNNVHIDFDVPSTFGDNTQIPATISISFGNETLNSGNQKAHYCNILPALASHAETCKAFSANEIDTTKVWDRPKKNLKMPEIGPGKPPASSQHSADET